ncbi:hypothetical protein BTO02_11195 [Paraburkholderia sp. SOS3]|nr:hypothetical protein BTO02_11195 [Paraburkholderia sp. SOS3]
MPNFSFSIDGEHFLLDGMPLQIRSAEMHPARIPAEYSNVCRAPSYSQDRTSGIGEVRAVRLHRSASQVPTRLSCHGASIRCGLWHANESCRAVMNQMTVMLSRNDRHFTRMGFNAVCAA